MIVIILLIAGFFLASGSGAGKNINGNLVSNSVSGNTNNTSGDVQVVKIHVEGAQYILNPSIVKEGTRVLLEADVANMPGCSKSIVSPELGISKVFSSNDNTLEFTPTKAGTFYIACSMNMYRGTITVLQPDGSKSNYTQKTVSSGASCSAVGGRCGCGG